MTRPVVDPDLPSLFLDTNIVLDVLWARDTGDDSAELVEKVRNRGWRAMTSSFAIMEVTSQEQEERYIYLPASSEPFQSWSAHPEVG